MGHKLDKTWLQQNAAQMHVLYWCIYSAVRNKGVNVEDISRKPEVTQDALLLFNTLHVSLWNTFIHSFIHFLLIFLN